MSGKSKIWVHFVPDGALGNFGAKPATYYAEWTEDERAWVQERIDTEDPTFVVSIPVSREPGGKVDTLSFSVGLIRLVLTGRDGW